jgi:excinuclease ABC subunit C
MKLDISHLPNLPGIYMFKGEGNKILYIGKAKSIKKRVQSYFSNACKDWKIDALINEAREISFVVTGNEQEAILLEAQMISDYKPKYNVLLKDGQPFIYYLITCDEIPKFEIVRNKVEKGYYIGPFFSKQHARQIYYFLVREFKLKLCNKKIKSGCLDFHIGSCSGFCMDDFDLESYIFRLELVKDLLENNLESFKDSIEKKILDLNNSMEYEKASHFYKYLENLESILNVLSINYSFDKYVDDVAYSSSGLSKSVQYRSEIGEKLKNFLKLEFTPSTIDCFDISHFQGKWIVGSCVRFKDGKPDKSKFRRFKIRTLDDQNDYAALQEIVMRRYKDIKELPNLILIDGGKGQLSSVEKVLKSLSLDRSELEGAVRNIECISLAKKEEILFGSKFKNGIKLDPKSEVGRLLMAIRDYAHHFAISYHRKKRSSL